MMPNGRTQYLRVRGRLYPDRQMTLRLGYLTETPPWSDREGDSPLRAEIFDDAGAPLGSYPLRLSLFCLESAEHGGSGHTFRSVRGFVPFHPRARRVVFSYRGQPLHEISRSEARPRTEWTWQPAGELTGAQTITWRGEHPNGLPVEYFLRYSWDGGRSWSRLGIASDALSQVVDFDQLPGGERCLLLLVATDGINTTIVPSEPFSLPLKPCAALILQPLDGGWYAADQPVLLQGQGFWREANRPEWQQLAWYCDAENEPVARGGLGQLHLPPGEHTVTLLAGSEAFQGSAAVTITVVDAGSEPAPDTGSGPTTNPNECGSGREHHPHG